MNSKSATIKHRQINLNNDIIDLIEICERNSNYRWLCCMMKNPNQSYLQNYVHESFFESNYKIIKESTGRPILLKNNKKHTSISISHKENIYVIAQSFKKKHSIGVDIETYNPSKDYSFIARSLHPNESLALNKVQRLFSIDLNKSYICIWTIKECLVKILNKKVDWYDIEIKISKHDQFEFYVKNTRLVNAQVKVCFDNNIIISVVYI